MKINLKLNNPMNKTENVMFVGVTCGWDIILCLKQPLIAPAFRPGTTPATTHTPFLERVQERCMQFQNGAVMNELSGMCIFLHRQI